MDAGANKYITDTQAQSCPNELIYKEMVAKKFSKAANQYDNFSKVQQDIAQHSLDLLAKAANKARFSKVLDLGCGTAKNASQLLSISRGVIGIDISNKMLTKARQNTINAQALPGIHLINADMEHLPLANACVDGVYSSMAMQWCKSPMTALAEIDRVLAPNAKAILAILVGESFESLHNAWRAINKPSRINRFYTDEQWRDAAKAINWKLSCSRKSFSTYHHSLHDILYSIKILCQI